MIEVHPDVSTFRIEFLRAEAHMRHRRLDPRVEPGAAVALLLGVVEPAGVRRARQQLGRHILFLRLQFLDADDVGVLRGEPLERTFARRGPDAIEVQRDNAQPVGAADRLRVTSPESGAGTHARKYRSSGIGARASRSNSRTLPVRKT